MPTVIELRRLARENGCRGYSSMKKAELEQLLANHDVASELFPPTPKINSRVDRNVTFGSLGVDVSKKLPAILVRAQELLRRGLSDGSLTLTAASKDGRVNSNFDEDAARRLLRRELGDDYVAGCTRKWWDFRLYDEVTGWFPVNFKSTTGKSSDNAGGMAAMTYACTNIPMNLDSYYDGKICTRKFIQAVDKGNYNQDPHRDYYFLVVMKESKQVIAQSLLGLQNITANRSNLPFQVSWPRNTHYNPHSAESFVSAWRSLYAAYSEPTWQHELIEWAPQPSI
jgi:hypothetical protein